MQDNTVKVVDFRDDTDASIDVGAIISLLEDGGIFQSAQEMRELLTGTEALKDTDPLLSYYWGWLECLETQEMLKKIA